MNKNFFEDFLIGGAVCVRGKPSHDRRSLIDHQANDQVCKLFFILFQCQLGKASYSFQMLHYSCTLRNAHSAVLFLESLLHMIWTFSSAQLPSIWKCSWLDLETIKHHISSEGFTCLMDMIKPFDISVHSVHFKS
jgi:hypothetical protein